MPKNPRPGSGRPGHAPVFPNPNKPARMLDPKKAAVRAKSANQRRNITKKKLG